MGKEGTMNKEEIIALIKLMYKQEHSWWDLYFNKPSLRDKRMEHFFKMQILEDLLYRIGEDKNDK